MLKFLLLLALAPSALFATPTRALTVDQQNLLIFDDFDGIYFYHLSPGYKNHLYADYLATGQSRVWGFFDVGVGTLTLWWNNPYAGDPLFKGAAASTALGRSQASLSDAAVFPHAPLENRVQAPNNLVSIGYGVDAADFMNVGLCIQYATLKNERNDANLDGAGGALVAGAPYSQARYFAPGAGYYASLTETSYSNVQQAGGLGIVPMLGLYGERFSLDFKFVMLWNTLENRHTEALRDAAGGAATRVGTLTQSLKDKGALSWSPSARLRIPLGEGTLVLRGSLQNFDLSTEHRQQGSFSGAGFANADELAGFDHVDAAETLTVQGFDSMAGWVHSFGDKGLLVLGLGLKSSSTRREDIAYSPRSGGPTIKYNDLVKTSRTEVLEESLSVPALIGVEISPVKWLKARTSAQQNFYSSSSTSTQAQSFNSASGALAAQQDAKAVSNSQPAYSLAAGLGLEFGAFAWDLALNSSFLASTGALSSPAAQTSLTWGY